MSGGLRCSRHNVSSGHRRHLRGKERRASAVLGVRRGWSWDGGPGGARRSNGRGLVGEAEEGDHATNAGRGGGRGERA